MQAEEALAILACKQSGGRLMGVQWRGLRFVAVLAFVLSGACFPDPPKRDGGDADGIEAIDTEDTASPDTLPEVDTVVADTIPEVDTFVATDTFVVDTEGSETILADTEEPDAIPLDTEERDTSLVDSAQPDTVPTDTTQPDTADTVEPDTVPVDTVEPDTTPPPECVDAAGCAHLDSGQCIKGACDDGHCVAEEVTGACDDGDPCTVGDQCGGGECRGAAKSCDDGIACTVDSCVATTGACEHAAQGCGCQRDSDCVNTADVCDGTATCDLATFTCVTAVPDDGTICDDGIRCTYDDRCHGGTCQGQPVTCAPSGNVCKPNVCNEGTGTCQLVHAASDVLCDDGDLCTTGDRCALGNCSGEPVDCSAIDQCHVDGVCSNTTGRCSTPWAPRDTACTIDGEAGFCRPPRNCVRPRSVAAGKDFTYLLVGEAPTFWGVNNKGQHLGLQSPTTAIATGEEHACLTAVDGHLECWGSRYFGQTGLGYQQGNSWTNYEGPIPITGRFVDVTAGAHHSCGVRDDGVAWCWGDNSAGQCGGTNYSPYGPSVALLDALDLGAGVKIRQISAGGTHTCAVLDPATVPSGSSNLKCWGGNQKGQLGYGDQLSHGAPSTLGFIAIGGVARTVRAGRTSTCVLLDDGRVKCWGANDHGQLGSNQAPSTVVTVPSTSSVMTGVAELSLSDEHVCVVTTQQAVRCWGNGANGRLGYGATTDLKQPGASVVLGGTAQHVAAGYTHTCAILTSGKVKCWGHGAEGALGNGVSADVGATSGGMPPADVPF